MQYSFKDKFFLFGVVPTNAALAKRYMMVDTSCSVCSCPLETNLHVLCLCESARKPSRISRSSLWRPPDANTLKVNVDVAINGGRGELGVGQVSFAPRSSNKVAHALAKRALICNAPVNTWWGVVPPDILFHVLGDKEQLFLI
ncbi:conserved hypothetical protein [Ricinus communis]|uniref:RNase H type-1 domain-containing protein n=1 Tax=Ricinus communis TaxID=3988 RepID=B9T042_RICCO|nr:conserved hypothetical protein [Ricinus communis]